MIEPEKDSIIKQYCNNIKLSNTDVVNTLATIQNDKANEIIVLKDRDSMIEYVALSKAINILKSEIEKENTNEIDYDSAIEELSKLDSEVISSNTMKLTLDALEQVKELKIKLRNHNMIGEFKK